MSNLNFAFDIKIGHHAVTLPKLVDGFTHEWEIYIKAADEAIELNKVVERVVFHLHPTFNDPTRPCKGPIFSLKERGFGAFEIKIDVVLKKDKDALRSKGHEESFLYWLELPRENQKRYDDSKVHTIRIYNAPQDLALLLVNAGIKPLNASSKAVFQIKSNKSSSKDKDRSKDEEGSKKSKSSKKDKDKLKSGGSGHQQHNQQKKIEASLFSQPIYVTKNTPSSAGHSKVTASLATASTNASSSSAAPSPQPPPPQPTTATSSSSSSSGGHTQSTGGKTGSNMTVSSNKKEKSDSGFTLGTHATSSKATISSLGPTDTHQGATLEREKVKKKKDKKSNRECNSGGSMKAEPADDASVVETEPSSHRSKSSSNHDNSVAKKAADGDSESVGHVLKPSSNAAKTTSSSSGGFKSDFMKELEGEESSSSDIEGAFEPKKKRKTTTTSEKGKKKKSQVGGVEGTVDMKKEKVEASKKEKKEVSSEKKRWRKMTLSESSGSSSSTSNSSSEDETSSSGGDSNEDEDDVAEETRTDAAKVELKSESEEQPSVMKIHKPTAKHTPSSMEPTPMPKSGKLKGSEKKISADKTEKGKSVASSQKSKGKTIKGKSLHEETVTAVKEEGNLDVEADKKKRNSSGQSGGKKMPTDNPIPRLSENESSASDSDIADNNSEVEVEVQTKHASSSGCSKSAQISGKRMENVKKNESAPGSSDSANSDSEDGLNGEDSADDQEVDFDKEDNSLSLGEESESHLSAQDSYNVDYLLKLEQLHKLMNESEDCEKLRKVLDILVQSGKASLDPINQTLRVDLCGLQRKTVSELIEAIKPV